MKQQQIYLTTAGVVVLALLLLFGKTVAPKSNIATTAPGNPKTGFSVETLIKQASSSLPISQQEYLQKLNNSISRGDVKEQQIKVYESLSHFWEDSFHNHNLYLFYNGKAAELVNSEKNLTFAARQFLENLRGEAETDLRGWKAEQAIGLYEKALVLNPQNDSLQVELGSCYVFGKGMAGDANETMKGIQQLLSVVRKDSTNMQAQLVLGIGGVVSSQYDKAIERLKIVVEHEPDNLEAISWLADAYAGKKDKVNAIKWYNISKALVNQPAYSKEVDERIKMLK